MGRKKVQKTIFFNNSGDCLDGLILFVDLLKAVVCHQFILQWVFEYHLSRTFLSVRKKFYRVVDCN